MTNLLQDIALRVVVMKVMTDDDNGPWVISIDGHPFQIAVRSDRDELVLTSFELARREALQKAHDKPRGSKRKAARQ